MRACLALLRVVVLLLGDTEFAEKLLECKDFLKIFITDVWLLQIRSEAIFVYFFGFVSFRKEKKKIKKS